MPLGQPKAGQWRASFYLWKHVKALIKAALDAFGRVDIMVNDAGYTHRNQTMMNFDEATFDRIFDVNEKAIFLAALAVIPVFRGQGGGVILNTASTAGLRPRPGLTSYLPGNGGLLYAVAMMAAGWDGAPEGEAPGFPRDGRWVVRWEGLRRGP